MGTSPQPHLKLRNLELEKKSMLEEYLDELLTLDQI